MMGEALPGADESSSDRRSQEALSVAALARAIAINTPTQITEALERLRVVANVDYIAVERLSDHPVHGLGLETVNWVDDRSVAAFIDVIPVSAVPNTAERLRAGELNQFTSAEQLSSPDREFVLESPAQIQSLLEVPISFEREWMGSVLFASRTAGREWADDEIEILRSVADMFAAVWTRDVAVAEAELAVAQRDRELRLREALISCSTVLLGPDPEDALPGAVRAVLDAIGGTVAYIDRNLPDHPDGPAFETLHIFEAGPSERQPDGTELWSSFPGAYAELSAGQPFVYTSLDELDELDLLFVRAFVTPVQASLDYPIMLHGELQGVVGIGDANPRDWQDVELDTLAAVSRMVAAHWGRESAKKRLEGLVDAKDEFLASVSHELRTPLAAILGLATVLRDDRAQIDESSVEEMLSLVTEQSNELANLIEDLLVFTRTKDAELRVVSETIDVGETVRAVLNSLERGFADEVDLDIDPDVRAVGDPLRVRQILRNLLTNARRHGGSNIVVAVSARDSIARVTVSDDGPGIPAEARPQLFDQYMTLGGERSKAGSLGVGLTVSRRLARLMGGDLTLADTRRTMFVVELPTV